MEILLLYLCQQWVKNLLLVNIYGPNRDTPVFYQNLTELIKQYQNHNVIAVGDWNLVLDPQLDCYNYKHVNNPKAKQSVDNMMSELELTKTTLTVNVTRGKKQHH